MTEFKIGDRVRFIGSTETSDVFRSLYENETIGTVLSAWETAASVRFDGVIGTRGCSLHNLELVPESPKLKALFKDEGPAVFAAAKEGFVTKDSGQRQEFGNGSVRDTEEGKPRYDLVTPVALKRLAELMARGAVKYGERNWELGQPSSRFLSSLMRHVECYRLGDRSEDHLAAAAYNVFALAHFEGTEWDDINE